jgi:multimeric flavodoxin WrbA
MMLPTKICPYLSLALKLLRVPPQIPETLPAEVLEKMHAAPKPDVPLADVKDLPNADGFLIGFPTRFGAPAAQAS